MVPSAAEKDVPRRGGDHEGKVARFEHEIDEDAPGAHLSRERAQAVAESLATALLGFDPARPGLLDAQTRIARHAPTTSSCGRDPSIRVADSSYRYEIGIQGDRLGRYKEYVKVPEAWSRDFEVAPVPRAETTATIAGVLLGLTVLAICVVLFRRIRLRDIRWRGGLFGLVGAVLTAFGALNDVPSDLYWYQTTESWAGFLLKIILKAVMQGAISVVIFAFVGSGEALYREMYPGFQDLADPFLHADRIPDPGASCSRRCSVPRSPASSSTRRCSTSSRSGSAHTGSHRRALRQPAQHRLSLGLRPAHRVPAAVTEESMSRMSIPFLRNTPAASPSPSSCPR
ncbi:MAG: hypothetical protein R3E12_11860 [Candidatus Eisenbacteria bacterium]